MPAERVRISGGEGGADQEEEALFSSASNTPSRCLPVYSVQSPSGSYYPSRDAIIENNNSREAAAARRSYGVKMVHPAAAPTLISLSPYSSACSSRESSAYSSFLSESKKTAALAVRQVICDVHSGADDADSTASRLTTISSGDRHGRQRLVIVDRKGADFDAGVDEDFQPSGDPAAPWFCIAFHFVWKLLVSLGAALLVFYLVTKPPPPTVSVQMLKIHTFTLRQGLDDTGVITNLLTCNCSVKIQIENHSKVFSLAIRPSLMLKIYGRLTLVTKQILVPSGFNEK